MAYGQTGVGQKPQRAETLQDVCFCSKQMCAMISGQRKAIMRFVEQYGLVSMMTNKYSGSVIFCSSTNVFLRLLSDPPFRNFWFKM